MSGPYVITLAEATLQIRDVVLERLENEIGTGGKLEGAKGVTWGRMTRDPKLPGLWIVSPGARTREPEMANYEEWALPLILVAAAKDSATEDPTHDAARLASNARGVLVAMDKNEAGGRLGRRLGLEYVEAVVTTQFDPFASGYPGLEQRGMHIAAAVVDVRFTILEPDAL